MCVCVCVCIYIHVYIYIYKERERERVLLVCIIILNCHRCSARELFGKWQWQLHTSNFSPFFSFLQIRQVTIMVLSGAQCAFVVETSLKNRESVIDT